MAKSCLALLAVSTCFGCASAGEPDNRTAVDAPPPLDARQVRADAAGRTDGATPMIDAPPGACADAFTGALATWDFSGATGSQTSSPSTASATGVVAGAVTRAPGLTASAGASSINSGSWSTAGSLDANKYYTLSLTAPSGCTLDVTSLAIDAKASGSGPSAAAVGTSADAFAQTASVSTTAPSPSVAVSATGETLEIRIFGWAATSVSGTFRVQNTLVVTGSVR